MRSNIITPTKILTSSWPLHFPKMTSSNMLKSLTTSTVQDNVLRMTVLE